MCFRGVLFLNYLWQYLFILFVIDLINNFDIHPVTWLVDLLVII